MMEFLAHLEKKEKQVCWEPIQAQEGTLVLKGPKETGELPACPACLAGKGPWAMQGLKDPQAQQDSQGHQACLAQSSLARKEIEAHPAQGETQVNLVPQDLQGVR